MRPAVSSDPAPITPEQLRAARALLGWSRDRLATQSDTTVRFIFGFENAGQITTLYTRPKGFDPLAAIRAALEAAGIEFVGESSVGPGVRLRRGKI